MKTIAILDLFVHQTTKPADLLTSGPNQSSWIRKLSGFLSRRAKRRGAIRSLEHLDNHLLADLGLQRQSIEYEVDRYLEISEFR